MMGFANIDSNELECWFNQILPVYLKEISVFKIFRPLPAMLGAGEFVDLFRLFSVVREKGGYSLVSENGLWGLVANEAGFVSEVSSSLKLFYFKYLFTLEKWVSEICREQGNNNGESSCDLVSSSDKLSSLLFGLDSKFKDFLGEISDHRKMFLESDTNVVKEKNCLLQQDSLLGDNDKNCVNGDDEDVLILDPKMVNEDLSCRKRKREGFSEMLCWVKEIAKAPGYSSVEKLTEVPKTKVNGDLGFNKMLLLVRKTLFQRKDGENSQKRQKIHPSLYEDRSTELRSSERLRKTSLSKACHESSITSQKHSETSTTRSNAGRKDISNRKSVDNSDPKDADIFDPFDEDEREKDVPIGSLHQAELPEWTGIPSESDSKWLGTRHWPLMKENSNSIFLLGSDSIGKGKQDSCSCLSPGSVQCVKVHIAEKRLTLKLELGLVFYYWRFHFMGEEVSMSWTKEEENKFNEIVKLNPPSMEKSFWDEALRCFPDKSRKTLVSYYFNVFLLRRRCYQNRITPCDIDSDDDESEIELVSSDSGNQKQNALDSKPKFCRLNSERIYLD